MRAVTSFVLLLLLFLTARALFAETWAVSPLVVPPNTDMVLCVIMNFTNQKARVREIRLFDDTPDTLPTPTSPTPILPTPVETNDNCPNPLLPGNACEMFASAPLTGHTVHCEFAFSTRPLLRASMLFLGPPDTPGAETPGPGTPTPTPSMTPTPGPGTPTASPASTPFQLRGSAPMHSEK
jgi:hypothetical protein